MPKAYVIVGGSLAGATAAITLREEGADGSVTLISAEREPPYERPPLSKAYLRGEVSFDKSLVRPAAFYAEHSIETMFGVRATRIDRSTRIVELEDGRRVSFDVLLIATGGRNRRLSIPGSELRRHLQPPYGRRCRSHQGGDEPRPPGRCRGHGIHRLRSRRITPAERPRGRRH